MNILINYYIIINVGTYLKWITHIQLSSITQSISCLSLGHYSYHPYESIISSFVFFFSSPIVRKYRINVISETDLDEKCNVIIMRNKTVLGTEYWYKVCSIKPISIEHGLLFSNENPMLNTWLLGNAFVHV